jgi:hypothetical protein
MLLEPGHTAILVVLVVVFLLVLDSRPRELARGRRDDCGDQDRKRTCVFSGPRDGYRG